MPDPSPGLSRFVPRAGTRVQLVSAAIMWAIGAAILITRGATYLQDRYWHSWALAAALALGVLKSRYLLDSVARKAITRIRARGRASYFGFFSWRSWLLIAVMMGGGMVLRRIVVAPGVIGAGIMGALYIGIGMALLLADRILWTAVVEDTHGSQKTGAAPPKEPAV